VNWGRRRAEIEQAVTEYRPNQTLAWAHVTERIGGQGTAPVPVPGGVTMRVSMESMGPGTRVVIEAHQTPQTFDAWLALRLVGRRRILAGFDRALRTLASVGG
jgi:hypothetical protein